MDEYSNNLILSKKPPYPLEFSTPALTPRPRSLANLNKGFYLQGDRSGPKIALGFPLTPPHLGVILVIQHYPLM